MPVSKFAVQNFYYTVFNLGIVTYTEAVDVWLSSDAPFYTFANRYKREED